MFKAKCTKAGQGSEVDSVADERKGGAAEDETRHGPGVCAREIWGACGEWEGRRVAVWWRAGDSGTVAGLLHRGRGCDILVSTFNLSYVF